ncbi:MAG TPA: hypothetical protein VEY10_05945 [Flavisolibacter sp.]|jgi:hypothetical protein|nr:hypothetical protein [Flavisolibacter sp.]
MQLFTPTKVLFAQLQDVLGELTQQDYTAQSDNLSGSTIYYDETESFFY